MLLDFQQLAYTFGLAIVCPEIYHAYYKKMSSDTITPSSLCVSNAEVIKLMRNFDPELYLKTLFLQQMSVIVKRRYFPVHAD